MTKILTIHYTDTSKEPIVIDEFDVNSIGLIGKNVYDSGVIINEGMLNLLENYSAPMDLNYVGATPTPMPTSSQIPLTPTQTPTPSPLIDPYCSASQTALRGSSGLTMIQDANQDDANIAVVVPFPFYMFGTNYGNGLNGGIFVGSNGYVTFGVGKNIYTGITPSTIGTALLIGAGDRSYQRIYTGLRDGGTSFVIRFEGGTGTSAPIGSPTFAWELSFYQNSN